MQDGPSGGVTPDGCSVELYALLPPGEREADLVGSVAPPAGRVLELGCGAGRVTHPLVARGLQVVAVDESAEMLAHVRGAERVQARIETLRLDRSFDVVVLGSHLVNHPDDAVVAALLDSCAHHVAPDGVVLVERHAPSWFDDVRDSTTESAGIRYRLEVHGRPEPDLLAATVHYAVGSHDWSQTFTTRRLDDARLASHLQAAGLRPVRMLDESASWVVACRL